MQTFLQALSDLGSDVLDGNVYAMWYLFHYAVEISLLVLLMTEFYVQFYTFFARRMGKTLLENHSRRVLRVSMMAVLMVILFGMAMIQAVNTDLYSPGIVPIILDHIGL